VVSSKPGLRDLDWRPRPVFSTAPNGIMDAPTGAVLACARKGVSTAVEVPEECRRPVMLEETATTPTARFYEPVVNTRISRIRKVLDRLGIGDGGLDERTPRLRRYGHAA
jgi:hypothetical protein